MRDIENEGSEGKHCGACCGFRFFLEGRGDQMTKYCGNKCKIYIGCAGLLLLVTRARDANYKEDK